MPIDIGTTEREEGGLRIQSQLRHFLGVLSQLSISLNCVLCTMWMTTVILALRAVLELKETVGGNCLVQCLAVSI